MQRKKCKKITFLRQFLVLHSFFFTCTCSTMLISLTVKKEHYDIHVTDSWRVSTVTTSKIFNQYTSVMSNKMKIAEIKTKIFLITRYLKSNHKQQITNKNKVHCALHLNLKGFFYMDHIQPRNMKKILQTIYM